MALSIKIKKRVAKDGKTRYLAGFITADGRERSAGTYGDKRVARAKAQEALAKSREAGWVDPTSGRRTLGEYAEQVWLPSKSGIEVSTHRGYDASYRKHIRPVFGPKALNKILPSEVGAWLNNMERKGVGRATQRHAYVVLNMILKSAMRDRLIANLPTAGVQTSPVQRKQPKIFTPAQWKKFLAAIDPFWAPLCVVGVGTGMRSSELRALCPAQISWASKRILVAQSMVQDSAKKNGGARWIQKPYPKSGKARTIDVSEEVLDVLANAMERRGLGPDSMEPIFVGMFGLPFDQKDLAEAFDAACNQAAIPRRTPHNMRSTRASWLLKETRDLMYVRDQLGHADIATTQRYLAVVDDAETDNVTAYEEFMARRLAAMQPQESWTRNLAHMPAPHKPSARGRVDCGHFQQQAIGPAVLGANQYTDQANRDAYTALECAHNCNPDCADGGISQ